MSRGESLGKRAYLRGVYEGNSRAEVQTFEDIADHIAILKSRMYIEVVAAAV